LKIEDLRNSIFYFAAAAAGWIKKETNEHRTLNVQHRILNDKKDEETGTVENFGPMIYERKFHCKF
jgi:hypothetical protein